jgi:hypothetical protein
MVWRRTVWPGRTAARVTSPESAGRDSDAPAPRAFRPRSIQVPMSECWAGAPSRGCLPAPGQCASESAPSVRQHVRADSEPEGLEKAPPPLGGGAERVAKRAQRGGPGPWPRSARRALAATFGDVAQARVRCARPGAGSAWLKRTARLKRPRRLKRSRPSPGRLSGPVRIPSPCGFRVRANGLRSLQRRFAGRCALQVAGRQRSGLAGAPGRPGRGAPKMSAPGRGAGRCKKKRGAPWKCDDYAVRLDGLNPGHHDSTLPVLPLQQKR